MAPERRTHVDSVRESPAKRRKTSQDRTGLATGYDSQNDSGDDFLDDFETIETLPLSKPGHSQLDSTQTAPKSSTYVTQPTQVLEKPSARPCGSDRSPSIIQVAASSPVPSPSKNSPKAGGLLATAMAPAGTAFRLPQGIQRAPPHKLPVISISDDDEGPTFQGDSSDDDPSRTVDIRPSVFEMSRRGTESVDHSPEKSFGGKGVNRFKEITSNAVYKPMESGNKSKGSTLSGSVFDSRRRDGPSSSRLTTSIPPHNAAGTARKGPNKGGNRSSQSAPERAKAVDDVSLDNIDFHLREKVNNIRKILPWATSRESLDALLSKKGNYDDALDLLSSKDQHQDQVDLTMSDDDDDGHRGSQKPTGAKSTAKRQLKAPNRSIQAKYSSTQRLPESQQSSALSSPVKVSEGTPKLKKRLVQGRRLPSTPKTSPLAIRRERSKTPDSPLASDSGIASSPEDDGDLEKKVLTFFNTCSADDLADISSISGDVARLVLTQRPFKTLDSVRQISSDPPPVTKAGQKKQSKRPVGDKIVDTCLDMWTGYEAVDELVSHCEELGKPLAAAMRKWGLSVSATAKDGELDLVDLSGGMMDERPNLQAPPHDSGVGTPLDSPKNLRDEDEPEDQKVHSATSRLNKAATFLEQPTIMNKSTTLKDYQLVGLNWLALLYDHGLSCILADEMGLGKTCQVIAFLAHLLQKGVRGTHLVVVPGSTLENWLREFARFCPTLVVEPYYGLQAERASMRDKIEDNLAQIHVIVTTYDLASKKGDSKFLRHLKPNVCVYDEGHALKNSTSQRYEALMRIPAKFRLLLTGTPLQNNLRELAALLGFILPSIFKERKGDLEYIFKHKAKTTDDDHSALLSSQRIARARSMMTPFILRRKKQQVLKHLPPKTTRVEYCNLTPAQWEAYSNELQYVRDMRAAKDAGRKPPKERRNAIMQLRKAAIHPLLFRRLFDDTTIRMMAKDCLKEAELSDRDENAVFEDMEWFSDFQLHTFCEEHPDTMAKYNIRNDEWMDSGKVVKLSELLLKYRENGDRVLVFSQFTMVLDILEAVLETLQMQFFRLDGQTKIDERQDMIDQFHEENDVTVFLLSTKAGGMGINLACANKVIIFDQSFNPQEDVQAENRAHRVGQQREVEVVRLVTSGTIEEQIFALGESKLALDDRVSGEGASTKEEVDAENEGIDMVEKMWVQEAHKVDPPGATPCSGKDKRRNNGPA
ncbi:MAG: hypothetical protein M1833_002502 [Piccolia ochrophora]|nr:MAG: hypothetical protein M1833_002502 [Piccolia ochrophora]